MADYYPHIAVFFKEENGKRWGAKVKQILNFSHHDFRSKKMAYTSESVISDVAEFNSDGARVTCTGILTVLMSVPKRVHSLVNTLQDAQGTSSRFDVALFLGVPGEDFQKSIELRGSFDLSDVKVTYAKMTINSAYGMFQSVTFKTKS